MLKEEPVKTNSNKRLIFKYLPGYAAFVRDNCLVPYIKEQVSICRAVDLPMMRFLEGMSDEQLVTMGMDAHKLFLTHAENNTLKEHLEESLKKWVSDQLVIMKKEDLTAEDISYAGYVRKKSLLKFLPSYTNDLDEAIEIINEIEELNIHNDIAATNVYIKLLKDRIGEQAFFTEVLSNTTPGLNYIFDLKTQSVKYANRNAINFFGNSVEELEKMGGAVIGDKVHPDELQLTIESLQKCANAADGAVISWELRLKANDGSYPWMRNYTSVYKRDEQGAASEIVGIILDINKEKEISDKLVQSERQLLDAQAQAGLGSYEMDAETGKLMATPQLFEILGITPNDELDGRTLFDNVHPDDRERIIECRERAIRENCDFDIEYRYIVNRTEKALWSRGRIVKKNGRETWSGTVMDITARHDMVRQLQESEARLKQAQALSHIGNWSWDLVTGQIVWSDELYRIYAREPGSEITFDKVMLLNHPDDQAKIKENLQDCIDMGKSVETYYRAVLKDGTRKMLYAKTGAVSDKSGKAIKLVGTIQDVTKQKLVEKKLAESQEFIQKVTDVTPSIIAAYNIHTGQFSFINGAVEKQLGYPQSTVMEGGVPFFVSITHPDDLQAIIEKNAKALEDANTLPAGAEEPIAEFKYRMKTKSGDYKWFRTFGTIFERNEKGLVESVLNISIDITEQEEAEQAVYQKNLQLQHSNTSLEEYAYVASHDLKEPLRKIVTFSDRMLTSQSETLSGEGKIFLGKIIESSRRMQKMVNDLLYVSTIAGNKEYQLSDLNLILSEALQPLDHKIEELKAIVDSDELPMVPIVPAQFRQLFLNLVSNSLKFQRKGVLPEIKITHTFLSPKAVERLELAKAKKYLKIELRDNGIGFDNQYSGKIFAIFQRLHGRSEYEGTGIGLAVCKRIVENHGGAIFAEGKVNEGATFTIVVPVLI
jgi:PAS domain S-box-containing protein